MIKAYRKLLEIMDPSERRRFWALVVITFFLSLVEAASVLSILPFLQLLANPEVIQTNQALARIYEIGGFETTRQFMIATGAAVFAVTVVGLFLKMGTVWLTTRFSLMRSYSISSRLMTGYLHQPYDWFLSRHSSDLGSSVLVEVDRLVAEALLPAMRLIPETFSVVLLVGALCFMEPSIAIGGAVLLGGSYGLIFLGVRRLLMRLGEQRLAANKARFHAVQEATGGLKELKILGLEAGFLTRYRDAAFIMANVQTKTQITLNLPRYALEAVAFGGMILLVLVLLVRGDGDLTSLVPTLGLIAAIGLRLIPALQQIYNRSSTLRQAQPVVDQIYTDLMALDPQVLVDRVKQEDRPPLSLANQLVLENIHYKYPTAEASALNGLTLEIPANSTIGVVGGTGAGKTTVIDIMLGLLSPAEGEMRVDGTLIDADAVRAWQKTLGYVPQTIFLSDTTVAENIAFGVPRADIDMAAVERAGKMSALHDFVMSELPQGYDTEVGERGVRLSGGQRQRIGIARALYHDPSTLILDEATSALDNLTEAAVMEAVRNIAGQKTIVMIAHRLSTVRNCDTIFLLRHGQVAAAGTYDELVTNNDEFRRMAEGGAPAPAQKAASG